MPRGTEVGLGPDDIVLDGTRSPPPKKGGHSTPVLAHVYCCQMVGQIQVKLGTEVGRGAGHIVLDGDPAPLRKSGTAPNFWPMSVVAKRLDQ